MYKVMEYPTELLQEKLAHFRTKDPHIKHQEISDCLITFIKRNNLDGVILVLSELANIYITGVQDKYINWRDIFLECVNSNNYIFLNMIEERKEIPNLRDYGFDIGGEYCNRNIIIYNSTYGLCHHNSTVGMYAAKKEHVANCKDCRKIDINKLVSIRSIEILQYLIKSLNINFEQLIPNIDFSSPCMKHILLQDEISSTSISNLFTMEERQLKKMLTLGEQLDIYIKLFDRDEKYALKLITTLIHKQHSELLKLIIDAIGSEFIPHIVNESLGYRRVDIVEFCYKKLKSETKNDELLKIVNNIGEYINRLCDFNMYKKYFDGMIDVNTYTKMLEREGKKSSIDTHFYTELTKYDQIIKADETEKILDEYAQVSTPSVTTDITLIPLQSLGKLSDLPDIVELDNLAKTIGFQVSNEIKEILDKYCSKVGICVK